MNRTFLRATVATAALFSFLAGSPTLAAPADQTPVTVEQLEGTILRLTPQIAWEKAVLRISGPGGYALSKSFDTGASISADLLAEQERVEDQADGNTLHLGAGRLPDGKYRYEVVLTSTTGNQVRHLEPLFVQGGVPVARQAVRDDLQATRSELASQAFTESDGPQPAGYISHDWILVADYLNDGFTSITLGSDTPDPTPYEVWALVNSRGNFHISECGSDPVPNETDCERYVMSFPDDSSGRVGIGTSAPLEELHIASSDGADLRLSGSGADWVVGILASSNQLILRDAANNASVVRLNQGAPGSSLVIAADGRIGVRVDAPEGDFHLTNADGTGDTVFKIARSGTGSWNLGHTGTGVFTFNKSGTGGQEFTVRNRNHAVATLDVQGHVRGTTFKNSSSRKLKTGFEAVDSAEILQKVSELPVTSWRYRDDDADSKHIGPVAEDFQRLFGVGDGETLSTVDIDGVVLAAIQGLRGEVEEKERRIAELTDRLEAERKENDAQIEDLNERLAAIEARFASVEQR